MSKPRARVGIRYIQQNIRRHVEASKLLTADGLWGLATSHLVLAGEEAVKASVLYSTMRMPVDLRIDLKAFFRKHDLRLGALGMLHLFTYFGTMPTEIAKNLKPGQRVAPQMIGRLKRIVNSQNPKLGKQLVWLTNASRLRNSGFYVDFNKGRWKTPAQVTRTQFERARKMLMPYIDIALQIHLVSPEIRAMEKQAVKELASVFEKWSSEHNVDSKA